MRPWIRTGLTIAWTAVLAGAGLASPLSSRLLPLVPPGAEIVAGFENHAAAHVRGRLLLTTRNNRLDLDDWLALTGADSQRVFAETIEVAAAKAGDSKLSEHMLLVAGRFDRERIVRSLEENGAGSIDFQGQRILLIKPLPRERGDMVDERWLAILNNRIGILGTQWLVERALKRYADHALADPILEERLALLRPDVTSWNVLLSPRNPATKLSFGLPYTTWAQLQEDADVLTVAVRFGPKIRIDFSIDADATHGSEFFNRKAAIFTDALGSGTGRDANSPEVAQSRLQNFLLEPHRVRGSVELTSSQFEAWCDHLYALRTTVTRSAASGN